MRCICFLLWRWQNNVRRFIYKYIYIFNYLVTLFSTSKLWMKTSKHRAISSSFHTISFDMSGLGKTKTGPGHRQFSLYHSLWYEWSGQNQNKMTWLREDWDYFFFLFLAFRGGHAVKRRGKQNTIYNKFQERNHWPNYFCISVSQIEFWTDMSSPSSHPAMFCKYTHFSCSFIFFFFF